MGAKFAVVRLFLNQYRYGAFIENPKRSTMTEEDLR